MELSTVTIPRANARQAAADYRRAAKREKSPEHRREMEEIARAYMVVARDEVPLIALTPTIAASGTVKRTLVWSKGRPGERRMSYLLPRLAACRWEAAFCYSLGVQRDGSIEFIDSLGRDGRYRRGRLSLRTGFELPAGYSAGGPVHRETREAWAAMVPIVPPKHRPARGMGDRVVLFEVDEWTWAAVPRPPGDPALLRHVGGDIYAVEATWNLTEIERLVLGGRRLPA